MVDPIKSQLHLEPTTTPESFESGFGPANTANVVHAMNISAH
jgi:hypothetical protein